VLQLAILQAKDRLREIQPEKKYTKQITIYTTVMLKYATQSQGNRQAKSLAINV
jgi:hypothetical protein